jgi:hypothetical protein
MIWHRKSNNFIQDSFTIPQDLSKTGKKLKNTLRNTEIEKKSA